MRNLLFFRYFAYSLLIIVFAVLQGTPNILPEICGSKPLLLICVAVSIAAVEDKIPALIFGAVCGAVIDISTYGAIGFFAMTLTLVCYFEAHIFSTYFISGFLQTMVFALPAVVCVIGVYFLIFKVGIPQSGVLFINHYVSRMIYTFIMTVPTCFIIRLINKNT